MNDRTHQIIDNSLIETSTNIESKNKSESIEQLTQIETRDIKNNKSYSSNEI